MKKDVFAELTESLNEVLAHAQGKITLKTKRVPIPELPEERPSKEIVRIRKKLGVSQAVFARGNKVAANRPVLPCVCWKLQSATLNTWSKRRVSCAVTGAGT